MTNGTINMIIIPLARDVMNTIGVVKLLRLQVCYYDLDKEVWIYVLWESQSLSHTTWRYSTCLIGIITLRAHSIAPPLIPMNTHTYIIHIHTYWSEHVLYSETILFSMFCFSMQDFFNMEYNIIGYNLSFSLLFSRIDTLHPS